MNERDDGSDRSLIYDMLEDLERHARVAFLDAKRRVEAAGEKWTFAPDADSGVDSAEYFLDEMINKADLNLDPPSDPKMIARKAQWLVGLCRMARTHPLTITEAIIIGYNIAAFRKLLPKVNTNAG